MAPGIKKLQRIQFGKETTAGTKVVATSRWRGMGTSLEDGRKLEEQEELVGIIGGVDRTAIVMNQGKLALSATPATPEQFQYLPVMAFGGPTSGASDGTGSDKVYVTTIPTTAQVTTTSYTVETGDDREQEYATYALCTKFTISGKAGETAKMSGELMTRGVQRLSAGFSTTTLPAVSELPVSAAKLFLDPITGPIGTTQIASQILGFTINYQAMWIPKPTMDGSLDWTFAVLTDYKIDGEVTFEHDTAVLRNSGAKADFVSQTAKLMRIQLIGDVLATPGTAWQTKGIIFDHPIKWLNPPALSDMNGNDTIAMKFRSRYNTTYGSAGSITVVNETTTLP